MLNNVKKGDLIEIIYTVTSDDVAAFAGETVHEVCSTFTLAREAEWCSRQFVLKMRENHEEGVGTNVTVEHISPAFIGETITFVAKVEMLKGNELRCSYRATVSDRLVATGITGQKILTKEKIAKIFSKFD